ncbi:MAG TPA: TonB-dependent receptor [Flavobacterium sp.]|nr:TonB-dependent receptor [Flavobacterium sp.]
MRLLLTAVLFLYSCMSWSQFQLSGTVTNVYGEQIANSHIDLNSICTQSDASGNFTLSNLKQGEYLLKVQSEGYALYQEKIVLNESRNISVVLNDEETLETIVIHTAQQKTYNQKRVTQKYLQQNYSGSLSKTLANVVGLDAVTIGSQTAKPMMRGLGFTRMAVTENGIKQEGQQWGADHGLELDALTTESVEVIKGVGTIAHGSDAIAGVIEVNNETIPADGFNGQYITTANSVNKSWANALNLSYKKRNHFYKFKTSYTTYADFRVPVDEIIYLSTKIPLTNGTMTNTAGNELSVYGQWGYVADRFQSILSVSQFQSKAGFFAGAHGVPSVDDAKPDGSDRNIGMPYQQVYHTKVTYHAKWRNIHDEWDFKVGFQRNHRQELSFFHTHYSNQQPPEINPDVELDFKLITLNSELTYKKDWILDHTSTFGVQQQYQTNAITGYSYLMPAYNRWNVGFFGKHLWNITPKTNLEFGARYDQASLKVDGYFDAVLYDYLTDSGSSENDALANAQRSTAISKDFSQGNIALGISRQITDDWDSSLTIATNFRFPTAMELSSNGIHHGAFRHEQGNPDLNAEKGWAVDFNHHYHKSNFKIDASIYLYYFSNYIFLRPSGTFSILPHGGQVYQYDQSKALLTGLEVDATYQWEKITVQGQAAYLYNKQIREDGLNYPLPFSTPTNGQLNVRYQFNETDLLENHQIQIGVKGALQQNRIAQNEDVTPGYAIANIQWSSALKWNQWKPQIRFQVNNVFNKVYYHHNSFYRPLGIPEFGRTFQIFITIPF